MATLFVKHCVVKLESEITACARKKKNFSAVVHHFSCNLTFHLSPSAYYIHFYCEIGKEYLHSHLYIPGLAVRKGWKCWTIHGNTSEPSHNRKSDRLEITEAKSQKIDHIQQNGCSGQNWCELELAQGRQKKKKKKRTHCDNSVRIFLHEKIHIEANRFKSGRRLDIEHHGRNKEMPGRDAVVKKKRTCEWQQPEKRKTYKGFKRWRGENKVCCSHLDCVKGLWWEVACSDAIDREERREEVCNREVHGEQLKKGW